MDKEDWWWHWGMGMIATLVGMVACIMLITIIVALVWLLVYVGIESYCRLLHDRSRIIDIVQCYH